MWDVYLQSADPFLCFFMALVILVNARDQILEAEDKDKQHIVGKGGIFVFFANLIFYLYIFQLKEFSSKTQLMLFNIVLKFKTSVVKCETDNTKFDILIGLTKMELGAT